MATVLQFPQRPEYPKALPLGYQCEPISLKDRLTIAGLSFALGLWLAACMWGVIHLLQWAVGR